MAGKTQVMNVIRRGDGGEVVTLQAVGKSVAEVLKEQNLFDTRKYSVCVSGKGIEDGRAMLPEEVLDDMKLEAGDEVLLLPKVVGGSRE